MLQIGSFQLAQEDVQRRKDYLEITKKDERRLKEAHSRLQSHRSAIIERFYAYLLGHEHTRKILEKPDLLERLKELQARYFMRLTSGRYDLEYFENRVKVGQAHYRIGLHPEWYLGAYVKYLHIVSDVLSNAFGRDYEVFFETFVSLTKIIYLDMGLALDAYHYSAQEGLEKKTLDLEEANAEIRRVQEAKQQLSDMIVHDLQNPLGGIQSVLQVLEADPEGLSEGKRQVIREALRRCGDLSQMIRNVLYVSRAEKGELEAIIESVELHQLIRDVAAEFQATADLSGHTLHVQTVGQLTVRTDENLVRRMLQNLIRNALRHTPNGTTIALRMAGSSSRDVQLTVSDDGPGIPPEFHEQLFQPFAAAALRAAGRRVDTGLGLASCKAAARALGGRITVESDGKKGTAFVVDLPAR